jgi:lysophospholipase L1-like esterase
MQGKVSKGKNSGKVFKGNVGNEDVIFKRIFIFLCLMVACSGFNFTFGQKKIVVLGSSTASGTGSSPSDSSWVRRLYFEYNRNTTDLQDTVISNLGIGGFVTYNIMPTGFVPPAGRQAPSPAFNITQALALSPDIIIINMPSNDVAMNFTPEEIMNNFRTLFEVANNAGVKCYITTKQPRNFSADQRLLQRRLVDSILNNFGNFAINVWDDLVSSDGTYSVKNEVNYGDGIHVNNLGHRLIFERVKAKLGFEKPSVYYPVPGKIEAENYSSMSGIQKEAASDAGGGLNVGYIDINDWMNYQITTPSAGTYTIKLRISSQNAGGQVQVQSSDRKVLATLNIPQTGGWQNWQTISAPLALLNGNQTIRLVSVAAEGWNINWMDIATSSEPAPLPTKRVEAEDYNSMMGIQTEQTLDEGGGLNVGYIDLNDWMDYNINVESSGMYALKFRVAALNAGSQMQIRKGDGSVLATLNIPQTGNYQSWQTISTNIPLTAGSQVIRLVSSSSINWNLNWLEPAPVAETKKEAENYASMSGVLTEPTTDAGGGLNVGYIDLNDWMDYNYIIPTTGSYTIKLRVASLNPGGQVQVKNSAGAVLATLNIPQTGGYQNWQTINANFNLIAGEQIVRLFSSGTGNWNINWLEIINAPMPAPLPSTRIEAENYSSMNGVQVESTTDVGGGLNVGYIDMGDWMQYPVNISSAGTYTIKLRLAALNPGGQVQVKNLSGTVLASLNVPHTGDYQAWQTINASITLPAGNQSIQLYSASASNWNINWLEIVPPGQPVITVNRPEAENNNRELILSAFPNPARDRVMLRIDNPYIGNIKLKLTSLNGLTLKEINLTKAHAGSIQYSVNTGSFASGTYILTAEMKEWNKVIKLVKQ